MRKQIEQLRTDFRQIKKLDGEIVQFFWFLLNDAKSRNAFLRTLHDPLIPEESSYLDLKIDAAWKRFMIKYAPRN